MRFVLLLTLFVSACGQVGPLVLPDKNKPPEKAQPPPPPSAPEDVERQKKQSVSPSP